MPDRRHIPHLLALTLTVALALTQPLTAQAQPEPAGANATLDTTAAIERARRLAGQTPAPAPPIAAEAEEPVQALPSTDTPPTPSAVPEIEGRALGATRDDSLGGGNAMQTGNGWLLSTLTALGLVIGLILLLRMGITRFGKQVGSAPSRAVEVLSRTSVAPRNHVLLLRVGGRVLVVGDSGSGLRTLSQIDDPEEVASILASVEADRESSMTHGFNRMLLRYTGTYGQRDQLTDEGGDDGEVRIDRARESVSSLLGRVRTMTTGRSEP